MLRKCRRLVYILLLVLLSFLFTGVMILYFDRRSSSQSVLKEHVLQGVSRHVKHTHLFLGSAAGQGLAGRVQCEELTAIDGTHKEVSSDGSCLPTKRELASFVTFFVQHNEEQPQHNEDRVADGKPKKLGDWTFNRVDKPFSILSVFLESIQISMPGSVATILTDHVSHFSTDRLPMKVSVHRSEGKFSRNNLMLQRLESYIDFLQSVLDLKMQSVKHEEVIEHILFVDSDIIVVNDLGCVFKNNTNFDIALTFRNNKDQPINSGVIMVRGHVESILRARNFLVEVVKVFRARFNTAARMLGDQLALASIVQMHSKLIALKFKKSSSFEIEILRARVLFLPSQLFNWTPSEGAGQFHGMPEDVKVLHFKGSRKRLMIEAWNSYKRSGGLSDMKCLILRSGRAKYDF